MEPGSAEESDEEDRPALPGVEPWKKILVSIAGVTGNAILAFLIALLVFWVGKPCVQSRIGYVDPDSAAWEAGLRIGDRITAVDGEAIDCWDDFMMEAAFDQRVVLTVSNETSAAREVVLATEDTDEGIRIVSGLSPVNYCRVGGVVEDSSAERAGLRRGDTIVEFAGQKLMSRSHLVALVEEHADRPTDAVVEKDGEERSVTLTPEYDEEQDRVLIGILFEPLAMEYDGISHPRPSYQLKSHASQIFNVLRKLATPRESREMQSKIGGPVLILGAYWKMIQIHLMLAIWFTGFLNVNLAILNILPLPVLDGGHVVVYCWEWITGRPASRRLVAWLWNIFTVLLIALLIRLTWNDLSRWKQMFGSGSSAPAAIEETNSPPADSP
jgi:regulator of sigma E protease